MPHSLGWSESSPQLWKDATYDVFESRGILPVSDWSQEYCFVGIRESFVAQLLVQGSNWGSRSERLSEEERDATWKRFLMDCGANLTSPGLSVHSGALVLVLICVHHVLLVLLVQAIDKKRKSRAFDYLRSEVYF